MWGKHGWVLKLCVYGSLSDTGPSNTNLVIKGSAPAAWRVWFDSLVCFSMFLLPIVSTWLFVDFVSIRCPPQTLAWGHCDVVEEIWFEIMGVSWQTLVCGGVWCYEGLWSMVQIYINCIYYIYVNFIYHAVDGVGVFVIYVSAALKNKPWCHICILISWNLSSLLPAMWPLSWFMVLGWSLRTTSRITPTTRLSPENQLGLLGQVACPSGSLESWWCWLQLSRTLKHWHV